MSSMEADACRRGGLGHNNEARGHELPDIPPMEKLNIGEVRKSLYCFG
jgi:hypothetical protein